MEANIPQPPKKGRITQMFSPRGLQAELAKVCHRFAFTIVYICLLALFGLVCIWKKRMPEYLECATWVSLSLGALLSLASYLWCEFLKMRKRSLLWQMVVLALIFANFCYLYFCNADLTIADGVGYSAAYIAAVVAIIFVPAVRRSSIKLQWTYSCGVVGAAAVGFLLFIVMGVFVNIIYGTISLLFSLSSSRMLMSCIVLFAAALPAMVTLCFLPDSERLENEDCDNHKPLLAIFSKNVLLPLALLYTLLLYVYGLKILVTWDLPIGNVCWMVIGLVSVCLLIVYGLQGFICNASTKDSSKRIAALAIKYIPALMLPLLVLMSVAIFYRIGQYGITASRLYVATFNIWAYGVAIYMIASRMPKLNLVASSFAIVFLATSVIPGANYCTISINKVRENVKERLEAIGVQSFPISYPELIEALKVQDRETVESIASDLEYLDDLSDHRAVADIVISADKLSKWRIENECEEVYTKSLGFERNCEPVALPEGYASVEFVKISGNVAEKTDGGLENFSINDSTSVTLPVDSLKSLGKSDCFAPISLMDNEKGHYMLVITNFRTDDYTKTSINIEGYLFKK